MTVLSLWVINCNFRYSGVILLCLAIKGVNYEEKNYFPFITCEKDKDETLPTEMITNIQADRQALNYQVLSI